jgi:isoleucyl-tRNA synthetase
MFPEVVQKLEKFIIDDLSKTYIQIIRERENEVSDLLNKIRKDLLIVLAPIIPFITENIWQELRKKKIVKEESVHLAKWPKADKKKIDKKLERDMITVNDIISVGLYLRDKEKIGIRWPLKKVTISTGNPKIAKTLNYMKEIIKSQINVKEIETKIRGTHILVKLDTRLTPELEAEGYAREMSRKVQAFRKKLGLKKKDRIELFIIIDDKFKKILEKNKSFIQDRTNSKNINIVTTDKEKFKNKINFVIKDKRGKIAIIITNK